ncbi:MAG TPA: molybdopterin-dependent oxidoreductase [Micromonosporaceae bacterium]
MAALVAPRASPLVAVGSLVIDNVPPGVKDLAIRVFGVHDKLALQLGTIVVLAGFAAAVGIAAGRRLWIGLAGVAGFGLIGVLAATTRVGAGVSWIVPSLVAAGVAALALWLLLRLADRAAARSAGKPAAAAATSAPVASTTPTTLTPTARTGRGTPRRTFLGAAWVLIGGAAVLGYAGRAWSSRSTSNAARRAVALPAPSGVPALAPPEADIADLSYTTSNASFYRIDTALVVPRIDPAEWTLKIHGRVARPVTLTFDDLLRRPMIERYITLACVSNEVGGDLIGNARWLGVPVKDLLDEAQPDPAADQVVSRSVDGFTAGTPTKALRDGRDALIAVAMNGEPLPFDHGFPARLVVPGLYGYVSATKWLAELELTTFADFDAYWIPRGWAQQAPIKTESRIDRPFGGATLAAGQVVVAGTAWAQHRGISRVEVRVDDGPWHEATLAAVVSIDTWRLWSWTWTATPGRHRLSVRATDNAGEVQTEEQAPPAPDGATGWHTITVTVS